MLIFSSPASAQSDKIDLIMREDTLGTTKAYLESILGPARKKYQDRFQYNLDGCIVSVTYNNDAVNSIALENLSQSCTFNITNVLRNVPSKMVHNITFGDLKNISASYSILETCLYACGNAYDPYFTVLYRPARAYSIYRFTVKSDITTNVPTEKLIQQLLTIYPDLYGQQTIFAGGYYNKIQYQIFYYYFFQFFKDEKIKSIMID